MSVPDESGRPALLVLVRHGESARNVAKKENRFFLDEESQALAMISDTIGKPVSLQVETAYNQEQYDIVLM